MNASKHIFIHIFLLAGYQYYLKLKIKAFLLSIHTYFFLLSTLYVVVAVAFYVVFAYIVFAMGNCIVLKVDKYAAMQCILHTHSIVQFISIENNKNVNNSHTWPKPNNEYLWKIEMQYRNRRSKNSCRR